MFYALYNLGLLKIQGKEAEKFLQGQLTCDVEAVTTTHPVMGAHCNPQGKVVSLFYLFLYQGGYYLLMQHAMLAITMASLKKYSLFFKVELTDCTMFSAIGKTHDGPKSTTSDSPQCMTQIVVSPSRSILVYDTAIQANPLAVEITNTDESLHQWKLLNIAEGIPTLYPETSGKFFPHEIHLDQLNAIHFAKGCYTGQEIIARTHYRGKSKNHLYAANVMSNIAPQPGSDIFVKHEQDILPCGMVVEAARKAYDHYAILVLANDVCATTQSLYWDRNKKIELIGKGEKKNAH